MIRSKWLKRVSFIMVFLFLTTSTVISFADTNTVKKVATQKHALGLAVLHENISDLKMAPKIYSASAYLPTSVDLSSKGPAPGQQGNIGSCVAWATGYAYKSFQEKAERGWSLSTNDHLFSPAFIYNQIHINETADGGGSYFSDAFNLIKSQGCTTLSDMPYNGNDYGYRTLPTAQQKANAANYKAKSWASLPDGNYNEIKAHVAAGDLVVIGIPVYPDFENISASNPIFDNTSGGNRGGHAICVVGYDDSKNAVKIINSWGSSWGLSGYGWMSYNLISQLSTEAYVMTDIINTPTPTPTTTPVPTITPVPGGSNVALKKAIYASASLQSQSPTYAVDGNTSTYWAASSSSNQWLQVDLGSNYNINSMKIKWSQTNFPKTYNIQSWTGYTWQNIKSVNGAGGINTITLSSPVNARHFRIYCNSANSSYYTIYEWEAYAKAISPTPTPMPTTTPVPTITPTPAPANVALKKAIYASASIQSHGPTYAVDGNSSTYWSAVSSSNQYLQVDLGASYNVKTMKIKWSQSNFPKTYNIQYWDGYAWKNIKTVNGAGGNNTITLSSPVRTRHFRIYCSGANASYFTIYEWEVYGNK